MEVKDAPARGLRAVFAGLGRTLGGRRKEAAAPTASAKAPAAGDSGHVKVVDTEETAAPETTVTPESVAGPETVAPETAAPEAESQPAAAEAPATEAPVAEAAPAAAAGDELPLASYDTLTVASLRARLRTLTVPQLRILVDYEKAHQDREEVTGMFERRIAKIVAGETSSFPAAK
jgi:cytoskeletal protein RodZ